MATAQPDRREDHPTIQSDLVAGETIRPQSPIPSIDTKISGVVVRPAKIAKAGSKYRLIPYYATGLILGLGIWTLISETSHLTMLPTPFSVLSSAEELYRNGVLIPNILASLRRAAVGYVGGVALAIPVGFLMGWYTRVRVLLEPWIQYFRAIPPLALIPLMVLVLGIGEAPKYIIIGIAAFLAAVIATYQGVLDLDRNFINAARVLGASDRVIFRRVVIPATSPYILVGARIALGNAWGTLVAAELISSQSGLGYMTQEGALYFNVPEIYVAIIIIGILGLIMDRIIYLAQRRATRWQERR